MASDRAARVASNSILLRSQEIRKYLELVSEQWDQALARLKSFVED